MTRRMQPASDVLVVGAGAAGAAAFLEAAETGADVLAIDQLPSFGGTAATSGGGCCVAGTPEQRERGIQDDPELALRDLLAAGGGEANEAWARFYFEHARREVRDWLVGLGVRFIDVRPQEHTSAARWHQPEGNGRGLMEVLWRAIEARGLAGRWRFGARLEDLVVEDGRVVGIVATDPEGGRLQLRARAVVVATGGFAGALDEVLAQAPWVRSVQRVLIGGGRGAVGRGHRILAAHGAALANLEHLWTYVHATPDYRDPSGVRGLVVRNLGSSIWVNRAGHRFHDESLSGPGTATPAVLAQQPPTCWAIMDRPTALAIRIADPYFRPDGARIPPERVDELLAASPHIHAADDPAALARAAGIHPEGLVRTLRDWNGLLASGAQADPATGRPLAGLRPVEGPPLYAMQLLPLVRKNLGGVRTDLQCRVLTTEGEPIRGLFAAGELAGFGGGHLSGRRALEGIMIGGSLFGGRVAGAWAAHAAGAAGEPRLRPGGAVRA